MTHNPGEAIFDVLSAEQFTSEEVDVICRRADALQDKDELNHTRVSLAARYRALGELVTYFWFDEPSTRTQGSFDSARVLLGTDRLGHVNASLTASTAKGESLADSLKTANSHLKYFGGGNFIIRHPDPGSAELAASIVDFPVINAGDGQNEHPTQALLDVYTIRKLRGEVDGLQIVMGGDPRYSRTIHSLAMLLSLNNSVEITFIGEDDTWLAESATRSVLDERGVKYNATTELDPLAKADVVYWTRLQTERTEDKSLKSIEQYGKRFALTDKLLNIIPSDASIMHPLPRGPELPMSVDSDPRAAYWRQVEYGVPVRAALMEIILRNWHREQTENR